MSTLSFHSSSVTRVIESTAGSSLRFDVRLMPPSNRQVTVQYATSNGSATSMLSDATGGADYAITNGTLTFSAGQTSRAIEVEVTDDMLDETAEALTLTLSNAMNAGLQGGASTLAETGIIDDNDVPEVFVMVAPSSVAEGNTATFTFTANPTPAQNLTVAFTGTGDKFIDGTLPSAVTFGIGSATESFSVAAYMNDRDDDGGMVSVTLNSVTDEDSAGYRLGSPTAATLTITDDEAMSELYFHSDSIARVTEGCEPCLRFEVRLSPPSSKSVSVRYATSNGHFESGASFADAEHSHDYTALSGMFTLSPGKTSMPITVSVEDDKHVEAVEALTLTLSEATNAAMKGGSPTLSTVGIIDDNDVPQLSVAAMQPEIIEGQMAMFVFSAHASPSTDMTMEVNIAETGDFIAGSPLTAMTMTPGQTSITYALRTEDDDRDEPDGEITATLIKGNGYNYNPDKYTSRVKVKDNDEAPAVDDSKDRILPYVAAAFADTTASLIADRIDNVFSGGGQAGLSLEGSGLTEYLALQAPAMHGQPFAPNMPGEFSYGFPVDEGEEGSTGPMATFWGRSFRQDLRLDDERRSLQFAGIVSGGIIGVDFASAERVGGISLIRSSSELDFMDNGVAGVHRTDITGIYPYIGRSWESGARLWGTLGVALADISREYEDEQVPAPRRIRDARLYSFGFGGYDPLMISTEGRGRALRLGLVADAVAVRLLYADAIRLRLGMELDQDIRFDSGGGFGSKLELTYRQDFGDALQGGGVELGGGLSFDFPSAGLQFDLNARALLDHEDGAAREWGADIGFTWVSGNDGRGLSLSLMPVWGAANSRDQQLWGGGISDFDPISGGLTAESSQGFRYTMELKYGIPVLQGDDLLQLYARRNTGNAYGNLVLGASLGIGDTFTAGVETVIGGERDSWDAALASGLPAISQRTGYYLPFMLSPRGRYDRYITPGSLGYDMLVRPAGSLYQVYDPYALQPQDFFGSLYSNPLSGQPETEDGRRAYIRYQRRF